MADRRRMPTAAGDEARIGGQPGGSRVSTAVLEDTGSSRAGSQPPSGSAMSTSSCSSGPGPISRTTRSAPAATWPRSGASASAPSPCELLPVLDNLQRALDAAAKQGDQGPLARGVAMVESQLIEVLGRFGITPLIALNQPFDPDVHEVLSQVPGPTCPRARSSKSCNLAIGCMNGSCARPRWPWRRLRHPRRSSPVVVRASAVASASVRPFVPVGGFRLLAQSLVRQVIDLAEQPR